jgi:hypothetical protein
MALIVSFVAQAVTGAIMLMRIKAPAMQFVFEFHEHNGLFLIAAVAAHVTLNRGWIRQNFFGGR